MRNKDRSWAAAAKKDSFFRNFDPENPKNMVINNQSLHADELDHRRLVN
jgi:hypothetical protein